MSCNLVYENGKVVDIKESGCGHWSSKREERGCCVPECRYYPKYGRIEDEEVIQEHKELEEYHRQRNNIVNIDISSKDNREDYLEFLKMWK